MFAEMTLKNLEAICKDELMQAYAEHGDMFSSDNEAWGVLMEEIEEAKQDMKVVEKSMKTFFDSTRTSWDGDMARQSCLNVIKHYALLCAAECFQVAACAAKAMPGVYNANADDKGEGK